jgi:hypothetical protein
MAAYYFNLSADHSDAGGQFNDGDCGEKRRGWKMM